jgi:hypothetical protein
VRQNWLTFGRNHAKVVVACDFFVMITVAFPTLYVFVVMEIGSRRILHYNATAHPTAEWTLQQFHEALPGDHPYRFLIHDRDRIFAEEVDKGLAHLGVPVLRTPVRIAKGELGMRATGREPSSGVSRIVDSLKRTPSANDDSGEAAFGVKAPVCLSPCRSASFQRAPAQSAFRVLGCEEIRTRRRLSLSPRPTTVASTPSNPGPRAAVGNQARQRKPSRFHIWGRMANQYVAIAAGDTLVAFTLP